MNNFYIYLLVMAGVTYLIRMLPLVLIKKKITNRFILSFLHYIPPAVLTVMTIPAVFYSAPLVPAVVGFVVAVLLSYLEKSLVVVALFASVGVFATDFILNIL